MENILLNYIQQELLGSEIDDDFDADTDLLGSGILDSLGMVQLIAFVENEFKIKVEPEEMVIENFMNINSVCTYVAEKNKSS